MVTKKTRKEALEELRREVIDEREKLVEAIDKELIKEDINATTKQKEVKQNDNTK
jgi:hypothetical protein